MDYETKSFIALIALTWVVFLCIRGIGRVKVQGSYGSRRVIVVLVLCIPVFVAQSWLVQATIAPLWGEPWLWITLITTGLIGLTLFYLKPLDPSTSLRSTPDESGFDLHFLRVARKVSDVTNEMISTYPRLSIDLINGTTEERTRYFDSSDFEEIRTALNLNDDVLPSLEPGRHFSLDGRELKVETVRIDFLSIFDDYSAMGRSKVAVGSDVPYNIQLIVGTTPVT